MQDRVGSLEKGKSGDVATFRIDSIHLAPAATPVNNLVYGSSVNVASTVVARGDVLVRDGKSTRFDARDVADSLNNAQASIIKDAGLEQDIRPSRTWPVVTG
jgi:cytosine/adenosine deaminase-related metal-dependent hydrolase